MIDNSLIVYIEQNLNRGYSVSSIQNALINQGYSARNILDTINYVQGNNQDVQKTPVQPQGTSKKGLYIIIPIVLVIITGASIFFFTSLSSKTISEEELSQGTNFNLKENNEVKFNLDEEVHSINVDSVNDNSVSLTIQSNPIKVDIKVGEEKKFDLDSDGFYDIKIKLNNINDGIPDFFIQKIHESTCVENWNCVSWSGCTEQSIQTRTCTDTNSCGTNNNKPSTTQSCTYTATCSEDWECTDWSSCASGQKTRTCTDANTCGTTENKPEEQQTCETGGVDNFDDEWDVFLNFLSAIDDRDLDTLYSLSYTDYSECFDNYDEEMCWGMIDGMSSLFGTLSKEEITDVWKDIKQTILSTEIEETDSGYGRKQIFFIRDSEGIKIILMKDFSLISESDVIDTDKDGRLNNDEDCSGNMYDHFPDKCIETNINNKDSDNDGWWDGIEVEAEKDPNDINDVLS